MVPQAGRRLSGRAPDGDGAGGRRARLALSPYWACQLGGWGLYGAVNLGLGLLFGRGLGSSLATALVVVGLGLVPTHALRAARGQRWRGLPLSRLAPRVVAASVALSCVPNALYHALVAAGVFAGEPFNLAAAAVWVFIWSVVYFGWQLIYFGVHAWRRARAAERRAWQLEAAARGAELGRLKAQLNPHFLFNCLNGLRSLIAEDPERARQMVTQLANMLRYSLTASAEETAELGSELAAVRDYLALEGVRLEGRLRVRFDVEPPCEGVRVPTMLVQLLVENAVKHGVSKRPDGGEVSLSARREGGLLRLEVRNPLGLSPSLDAENTGLGLANAAERLRLIFGDAASLDLRPAPGEMRAEVRLPWPT
jgi:two-component system sensor histidine kinase AlgZ